MTNLNKIYHKGSFRSGEWAKHLRPYLKRQGNKRFRKAALTIDEEKIVQPRLSRKKLRRTIKAKITLLSYGDRISTYYGSYRTMRDLKNAVRRPKVIRYLILNEGLK